MPKESTRPKDISLIIRLEERVSPTPMIQSRLNRGVHAWLHLEATSDEDRNVTKLGCNRKDHVEEIVVAFKLSPFRGSICNGVKVKGQ